MQATASGTAILANETDHVPVSLRPLEVLDDRVLLAPVYPGMLPSLDAPLDLRLRMGGVALQFIGALSATLQMDVLDTPIPDMLWVIGNRDHSRIPVPADLPLKGSLIWGETTHSFGCQDLSHLGAMIRVPGETLDALHSGLPCVAAFELEDLKAELNAIIMWKNKVSAGLLFPDMRRVSPESQDHPWVMLLHKCFLSIALGLSSPSVAVAEMEPEQRLSGVDPDQG